MSSPLNLAIYSLEDDSINEIESPGTVTFEQARASLSLFSKGLSRKYLQAKPLREAPFMMANPWRPFPFSNGKDIYLPSAARVFPSREENWSLYRLYASLQAGQWEAGTFDRPRLKAGTAHRDFPWTKDPDPLAFIRHFLGLFPIPTLAAEIFLTLESARLVSRLAADFRGLASDLSWILPRLRLTLEPIDYRCMLWNLFFDLLSPLAGPVEGHYPSALLETTRLAIVPSSDLKDTLAVTLAAYQLLEPLVPSDLRAYRLEVQDTGGLLEREKRSGRESYRAGKPREGDADQDGLSLSPQVEELLGLDFISTRLPRGEGAFLRPDVLGRRLRGEDRSEQTTGEGSGNRSPAQGEPPGKEERRLRYPEWDYLAGGYRRDWTTLFQLEAEEGDSSAAVRLIQGWEELVREVSRQFRLLRYQERTWRKKLVFGEEVDIQAAVERRVALRCGLPPSEKVYMEKRRLTREVSALFLLDLSASTSLEIQEGDHAGETVLELLLASVAIMARALEQLGDRFGIYGFSGYGRNRVEFLRIKSFDEAMDDAAWRRLGGLKSMKSTRMGTAVRHARRILEGETSTLKIMLLLSDGYPQDFDYGEDRTDREYGLRDTAQALREAKAGGIVPFCVTVDAAGHDYLRRMCPPHGYLVVRSVEDLPRELPKVYLSLRGG